MTGQEILIKLKVEGYIVEIGEDNYILSNKLSRIPETPKTSEEVVKPVSHTLEQFIADCRVPFRAKAINGAQYQLNGVSDYGKKAFQKIMLEGNYKYEDMVAATHKYYHNTSMARVTITNYFKLKTFEGVMEEYLKNKPVMAAQESRSGNGRLSL